MHHVTKAASATATDRGEFTALAATWDVDRVGDQIRRGAFGATIHRWQQSGKRLPVHWNHGGEATDVIGSIDPASMRETKDGLLVAGRLDLEGSDTAKAAWRAMKEDSMSLSFGYQVTSEQKDAEGVNVISGVDLFEVSIVPAPANDQTRVLSMKGAFAARTDDPVLTLAKVRQRVKASTTRQRADERAARARMPIKTKVFEV